MPGSATQRCGSLEQTIADLEGGRAALAAASGMGAINSVLLGLLRQGDHIIAQRSLYGGTFAKFEELRQRWGIEVSTVSGRDPEEVRTAVKPTTRLLYLESISNPMTRVSDLPALSAAARASGLITVVDNTFASPILC